MKKSTVSVALCLLFLCLASASARTWTQAATGKTLEGELTRVEGSEILITQPDGTSIKIPLSMLSEDDQAFIRASQDEKMAAQSVALPDGPVELVLAGAHLCCGACKKAAAKPAESLEGVEIVADDENITISAQSADLAAEAFAKVMEAGFYGTPSIAAFQPDMDFSSEKVESVTLTGVHLCCAKCLRSAEAAINTVAGVEQIEGVEKNSPSVTVTGRFAPADLASALHSAGFHAQGLN